MKTSLSAEERAACLFSLVAQKPAPERELLLLALCGDDRDLRECLEKRLALPSGSGNCPDPDATTPATTEAVPFDQTDLPDESIGETIGRYKLLEKIGEGGWGVVYVADQVEPVRRRVALKVIKLGMDTKQVVARFEAERQALALMDHPNIAKILDAGITATGRPYFVMEFVRGIRITDYCDQNSLTIHQRLHLFIQVCQAIQHAHQKGIIHRDIKPSNILVALNDGTPVPKVIDFGIAKATEGRLTEATIHTQLNQFLGTPAYMSPEQADMNGLDVDTRSDIYSLGVLLYELLTGTTPFDPQVLLSSGLDAMRRAIREEEPIRPSNRLSLNVKNGTDRVLSIPIPGTAKRSWDTGTLVRRKLKVRETIAMLKGDLDWIAMKCLEKDRTRRYETANGIAADLNRYLVHEPVIARPPSASYKLRKAILRNTLVFVAGGMVILALTLGVALTSWQAVRATRAESLAKLRLTDAETISQFLVEVFRSPSPARDGRTITVAEALGNAAKRLETDLSKQPGRQARLQATLGDTYIALGLSREAIPLLELARERLRAAQGPEHPETLMVMNKLGNAYDDAGRREDALVLREEVYRLRSKVLGPEHPDTLISLSNLAISYDQVGRRLEALHMEETVVAIRRRIGLASDPDFLAAQCNLAFSYESAGRAMEALRLREAVLEMTRKVMGPEHPDTLLMLGNLAESYQSVGRTAEALAFRESTLALTRKVMGPEHPDTLMSMENVADSYDAAGRHAESLKLREDAMALSVKALGTEHPLALRAKSNFTISLRGVGRLKEAIDLGQSSFEECRQAFGVSDEVTLHSMTILAVHYRYAHRTEEAIRLEEEAWTLMQEQFPAGHPLRIKSMENLAACYEQAGRTSEAEDLRRQLADLKARQQEVPTNRK